MTDLQRKALETAKEQIRKAYMQLSREPTVPSDFAKTDTFTHNLYVLLSDAENWIEAVTEDREE